MSRLSTEIGPSGFEDRVRKSILSFVADHVDEVRVDNLGNLITRLGNGPFRVLVSAHMDEAVSYTHLTLPTNREV